MVIQAPRMNFLVIRCFLEARLHMPHMAPIRPKRVRIGACAVVNELVSGFLGIVQD